METINKLELTDPDVYPDEEVLRGALGSAYAAYESLLGLFGKNGMTHEWRYYFDAKSWLCKVQRKKRTIVWMSAWSGFAKATIYFPGKYVDDVYGLDLGKATMKKIRETKNTGTSKPCIFEIRDESALGDFSRVMQFKLIAK